jgi:hypothetical protein
MNDDKIYGEGIKKDAFFADRYVKFSHHNGTMQEA